MTTVAPPPPKANQATDHRFLTFVLGQESFGIGVLQIREIIRMQAITQIPQVPVYIKGVINLRGKVIPVLDLRLRFGLDASDETERSCIVVVEVEGASNQGTLIGLMVDAVEEVLTIPPDEVENPPEIASQADNDYILGIAKPKGNVKTLLDINRIIADESEALNL